MKEKIKQIILENGAISVAEFMQYILLDPKHGYYQQQNPFGSEGDFITAPEISQIFGEIIGSYAAYKWLETNSPNEFQIIELGPGNGSLLDDFLRATKNIENFHQNSEIILIEQSNRLKEKQIARLKKYGLKISHYDELSQVPEKQSFIIANEFFDALPIYQYQKSKEYWYERKISLNKNNELEFILADKQKSLPYPNLNNAKDGDIYEYSLASLHIMQDLANLVKNTNSNAVIIDYGYSKAGYGDTLQALKKHKFSHIFDHLGTADLTAHVNFEQLAQIALNAEIEEVILTTQREFLINLGITARTEQLSQNSPTPEKVTTATNRLIAKDQMGELFKVLLLGF